MTNYSIIIPHYNIPDLLIRCLRSIPVREDVQVIVVDDCSPGADRYKKLYPELSRPYLELYSTPKGGSAGRARNIGLEHAKGKWVMCIDADDLFVAEAEKLLDDAINREEEIIYYNYRSVLSEDISKKGTRTNINCLFSQYEKNGDERLFRYNHCTFWEKMIRLDLINRHKIRCSETRYSNDVLFSLKCGFYSKKIAIVDKPLYIITQRRGSLTSEFYENGKISKQECKIRTDVAFEAIDFMRRHHVNYKLRICIYFCSIFFRNYPSSFAFYIGLKLFRYPSIALQVIRKILIAELKKVV